MYALRRHTSDILSELDVLLLKKYNKKANQAPKRHTTNFTTSNKKQANRGEKKKQRPQENKTQQMETKPTTPSTRHHSLCYLSETASCLFSARELVAVSPWCKATLRERKGKRKRIEKERPPPEGQELEFHDWLNIQWQFSGPTPFLKDFFLHSFIFSPSFLQLPPASFTFLPSPSSSSFLHHFTH